MPRMIGSQLGRGDGRIGRALYGEDAVVSKIATTMDHKNADKLVGQYGDRGPLPKTLPRNERMRAYEARYVHAGGPKGEKWQGRANNADKVTGAGVAVGAGAALTELATHRRWPKAATRSNRTALAAGGAAGISELYHRHAEHRARSYSHSRAGVAASALRRMRAYTPDEEQR